MSRPVTATYTRVINKSAKELIPDYVIIEVERILANEKDEKLKSSGQNKLERLWRDKMLMDEKNEPKYSYFQALYNPTTPLDYINNAISIDDISAIMLFLLYKIPIVSTKEQESTCNKYGLYFHSKDEKYACRRHIEILSDRIKQDNITDWEKSCVTTIIHELAHAFMDPYNYDIGRSEHCENYRKIKTTYTYKDTNGVSLTKDIDFYTVREETFAEILMYRMMRRGSRNIQNKYTDENLRNDISNKDCPYKIAANLLDFDYDFAGWIRAKGGKSCKIDDNLAQEWLSQILKVKDGSLDAYRFYRWEKQMKFPWISTQ